MHAHDVDPSQGAERARGHGGGEAVGRRPVDNASERGLAAGAKEHRVAQITQGAKEAQAHEILRGTLPETESGIEDQPLWRNPEGAAACRNRRHLIHELLSEVDCVLASGDLFAVMHDDNRHAALSGELEHLVT